jgi:ribose transport system ATP-binding protein
VVENVRIANFSVNNWTRSIKWDFEKEVVAELLRELNCTVNPNAKVGSLGPVDRAKVAIARSLQSARLNNVDQAINLLIFDESTRALPRDSLSEFYEEISKLVAAGTSVLLVSHSLDEVVESADRVTVLRDGEVLASGINTSEINERDLVQIMLGYQLREPHRKKIFDAKSDLDQKDYRVSEVCGQIVKDINFDVHSGEILGLTGLEGSGYEEIPYLVSGAKHATKGTLALSNEMLQLAETDMHKLIQARVFLVPERRESEGLAFGQSMLENITLPRVRERGKRFSIGKFWQQEEAIKAISQFGISPPHAGVPVGRLSGGNQQKVQLGKWLLGGPKLLFLHEPTQGVDVGARRDIVNAIIDLADSGVAVVVATIELELLEEISHRVIIFQEGEIGSIVTEVSVRNLIDSVHPDLEIKVE